MTPLLPPRPGAVFFDAVGTLIHPEPPAPAVYAAVGRQFGSRLGVDAVAARFRDAFRRQEEIDRLAGWRTGEAREKARWRAIVAETLEDVADPAACFRELFAHFARPQAWRANPEAGPALRGLAARGWHVGVASNFDARLRLVAGGLPELDAVREIVVSSEVGWRKPAPEFFRAVRHESGMPPGRTVFVGDDSVNDYDGALAAGLAAVLYDPAGAVPDPAVLRVGRLAELLGNEE